MRIGYSTGAISRGDWRTALQVLKKSSASAIELSALREEELMPLIEAIPKLDLSMFDTVFFHAPSKLKNLSESELADGLKTIASRQWTIILHPDIVKDYNIWSQFGELLCIENMDRRKPTGRTVDELLEIFEGLSCASFCFDIGHARHIDRTMSQAQLMVQHLYPRTKVIHLSEVNLYGQHVPLSRMAMLSISRLSELFLKSHPIILESPIWNGSVEDEIQRVKYLLSTKKEDLLQAG